MSPYEYVTNEIRETHRKYEHLLTVRVTQHRSGHGCTDGEPCRCTFRLVKGATYVLCARQGEPVRVLKVLGEIDDDLGGGGTWIVCRTLASTNLEACGTLEFMAPTSINASHMEEVSVG